MFGRRPDGRRLKNVDPIVQITPYLMPMRCDAQVFLEHKLDYEMLSRYIAQKGREGQRVTFMQLIIAAYVRGVSQHPEINRFIKNKQYYARNNLSVSFTLLKESQNHDILLGLYCEANIGFFLFRVCRSEELSSEWS